MSFEEARSWKAGTKQATFYQEAMRTALEAKARDGKLLKVVGPQDMPWEDSHQGRIKWLVHERMDVRVKTLDLYIQELPPGGQSGRHRHVSEEFLFVLEGRGHDLHWDMEAHIRDRYYWRISDSHSRWDWEQGDALFIPVNTVHQHFNDDPKKPARFLSATNRVYRYLGFPDLEQILTATDPVPSATAPASRPPAPADPPGASAPAVSVNVAGWARQMEDLGNLKRLPRLLKFRDFHVNPFGTRGITTTGSSPYPDEDVPLSVFKCWYAEVKPAAGDEETRGHSHQFEAVFYILDGQGYEIHDGIRYPWQAGDAVVVHAGCVHAHFSNPGTTANALVITAKPLYCRVNLKEEQPRPGGHH